MVWKARSTLGAVATVCLLLSARVPVFGQSRSGPEQPAYRLDELSQLEPAGKRREALEKVRSFWIAQADDPKRVDRITVDLEKRLGWLRTQDPAGADVMVFVGIQAYTTGNYPAMFPTDPHGGQAAIPTKRYLHVFAVLTNSNPPMVLHRYEKRSLSDRSVAGEAIKELEGFLDEKD